MRVILLMVFGAAGTLARYGLDGWIQYRAGPGFPFGTLTINLLGCFFLGAIGQFGLNHLSMPPDLRIGLTTGLMGGFTTFSTFGWDSVRMLETGEWHPKPWRSPPTVRSSLCGVPGSAQAEHQPGGVAEEVDAQRAGPEKRGRERRARSLAGRATGAATVATSSDAATVSAAK